MCQICFNRFKSARVSEQIPDVYCYGRSTSTRIKNMSHRVHVHTCKSPEQCLPWSHIAYGLFYTSHTNGSCYYILLCNNYTIGAIIFWEVTSKISKPIINKYWLYTSSDNVVWLCRLSINIYVAYRGIYVPGTLYIKLTEI